MPLANVGEGRKEGRTGKHACTRVSYISSSMSIILVWGFTGTGISLCSVLAWLLTRASES